MITARRQFHRTLSHRPAGGRWGVGVVLSATGGLLPCAERASSPSVVDRAEELNVLGLRAPAEREWQAVVVLKLVPGLAPALRDGAHPLALALRAGGDRSAGVARDVATCDL